MSVVHPTRPDAVNSLGRETRSHLLSQLESAWNDPDATSIVLIGRGRNFSAGADIREFDGKNAGDVTEKGGRVPSLVELCSSIESSPKPVVAALRGAVLGGGLELALACHYRVADASPKARTSMGLPETSIGLIPGAGGTQRLPRLCGVELALSVIVGRGGKGGKMIGAEEALSAGLVDGLVGQGRGKESLEECAARWATYAEVAAPLCTDYSRTSLRRVPGDVSDLTKICDEFERKLPRRERGGEAVRAAVEAVRASFAGGGGGEEGDFAEGMAKEEQLFVRLLEGSEQGRALRHAFFAERAAGKRRSDAESAAAAETAAGKDKIRPEPSLASLTKDPSRASAGVIGAGTMGSGIALSFLRAGYRPVVLVDTSSSGLKRGLDTIAGIVKGDVKRGRLSKNKAEQLMANLKGTTELADLSKCAIIVEAVFENLEVKRSVFAKLDGIARPDALLLTNTSTLDVDKISEVLVSSPRRRELSAGMHFFSPAHVMRLVEIVRGTKTCPEALDVVRAVTKRMGKVGVTVGNCDGFVGNRMLFPYTSEMVFLLQEEAGNGGLIVADIDKAMVRFGMSMGPFAMSDLAGNDIGYNIRREKGLVDDPHRAGTGAKNRTEGMRYSTLPDLMVTELGRTGQKAGKGWYDYDRKVGRGRTPLPSREVAAFVASHPQTARSSDKPKIDPREIVRRLLYPLINEGFKALEDGTASHPDDVDVVYLYGYGFPRWRGGPMHYADFGVEGGLPKLLEALEAYAKRYPGSEYYRPAELLRECVRRGVGVREYYEKGWHRSKKEEGTGDEKMSKL